MTTLEKIKVAQENLSKFVAKYEQVFEELRILERKLNDLKEQAAREQELPVELKNLTADDITVLFNCEEGQLEEDDEEDVRKTYSHIYAKYRIYTTEDSDSALTDSDTYDIEITFYELTGKYSYSLKSRTCLSMHNQFNYSDVEDNWEISL